MTTCLHIVVGWGGTECFGHGQLYVAASRVGDPAWLRFALDPNDAGEYRTKNVVYAEALTSLVASTEPPPIYPYLDAMSIEELTSWEQRVWDWQAKAWRSYIQARFFLERANYPGMQHCAFLVRAKAPAEGGDAQDAGGYGPGTARLVKLLRKHIGHTLYSSIVEVPAGGIDLLQPDAAAGRSYGIPPEAIPRFLGGTLDDQYQAAESMLKDQREALDKIAAALLKYETLSGDEIGAVLRGDDLEEFRAAQARQRQTAELAAQQKQEEKEAAERREQADAAASDENHEAGLSGA